MPGKQEVYQKAGYRKSYNIQHESLLGNLPLFSSTSLVQMSLIVMMDILGPLEREGWELEKTHIWEVSKEPGESSKKKQRKRKTRWCLDYQIQKLKILCLNKRSFFISW